ncbi:hypothetical protein FGO68_gene9697 [Halteria grandinella]|uniref:Uncharacterized protein n=1 Tax=Halteria grandinella TaxID=5974 RepID=A0A8J8ND32_HALGN|nr:hypothetical protein FGO68_gene9697 [Halteria grandinella]
MFDAMTLKGRLFPQKIFLQSFALQGLILAFQRATHYQENRSFGIWSQEVSGQKQNLFLRPPSSVVGFHHPEDLPLREHQFIPLKQLNLAQLLTLKRSLGRRLYYHLALQLNTCF